MKIFENRKGWLITGWVLFIAVLAAALILTAIGAARILSPVGTYTVADQVTLIRQTTPDEEDYSEEENTLCPVDFATADGAYAATVTLTYEEWEELGDSTEVAGYLFLEEGGEGYLLFTRANVSEAEIRAAVKDQRADDMNALFSAAITLAILGVSIAVILFFGKHFTLYEKLWFLSIMVLASVFAILFPEESCNGISGIIIMLLYLADTFLNILCELLISKQSKWNFIVSVFVELTEILICVVLAYRFATMATTLFFWLPIDIISFINWNRKPDQEEEELTRVRTLKGWQEVLIILGIVVWTAGIGFLLTTIDLGSELFQGNDVMRIVVCYLDACASAVGIVNGLAILFRLREQWISWYICAALEAAINILAGQYVLLVLKLGYFTNTTYGYIQWTKYIRSHPELEKEKSFF